MNTYKIKINRDINIKKMIEKLNIIDDLYDENKENTINVDFSNCAYISPSSLTILASYLKNKLNNSKRLFIEVKENPSSEAYISRVNFFKLLNLEKDEKFNRRDESGRFTTIKNINEMNYGIVDDVMNILLLQGCVSEDIYYSIDWSFNEVLDNIFEHSKSNSGAFLIAQSYDDRVEFCIVDNGIGIANSLRTNSEFVDLSNLECIVKSTEKEVTVGTGQGNGLYITRRFIEQNIGELHIYSDDGYIYIKDQVLSTEELLYNWSGTIVMLKIYKSNVIDILDVFDTDNISSLPVGYSDNRIEEFTLW